LIRPYLKAVIPYLKQVAGLLVIGSLGGLVMNTAVVLPAITLGRAVDTATAWGQGHATSREVLWAGMAYAGAMTLYQVARLVKRWGLRMGNQRIQASIRADALRGVLGWTMTRLYQVPIGDLMARIIGDVEVLGRGVHELDTEIWDTVLFSISLVAGMLVYNPSLTVVALIPVPVGMILAKAVGRWVASRTVDMREASATLTAFLQEHLSGLRIVRLFGRIEIMVSRADTLSHRLSEANLAAIRLSSGLRPIYTLLMMAGVVFVLWLGGERVVAGTMTLGAFIAYLDLYLRLVARGHRVPQLFNSVQSGAAAYTRLGPLLTSSPSVPPSWESTLWPHHVIGINDAPPPLPSRLPGPCGVSLQDVTFRYPGNQNVVLDGVSLQVPPGSMVAVTGPVGSGKSALAGVLLGFYPLDKGCVLLDGQPLEGIPQAQRASRIGYLPQSPFLFSGNVRANILLSLGSETADGSDAQVSHWLELAALDKDIGAFPARLDTEIGEGGMRISGGQRQRIALARAFASRPGLLVLDDPFSSVDVDTEARIVSGLIEAFGPRAPLEQRATIVFFSHRLAAFPFADQIVVLDGGRVVEQGTHRALVETDGLYARIFLAQQRVAGRGEGKKVAP
jgi:ATP-binding cassette subfamily B multidrug efflux pump